MRRQKTNAWRPPLVSKMFSLRWSLLKESEISPFFGMVPFLCGYVAPISVRGLWEFLHILIIILIQLKKFLFIYSLQYNIYMYKQYIFSQSPRLEQDVTEGQFLSGV